MKRRSFFKKSGALLACASGCTQKGQDNVDFGIHVGFGRNVVNDTFKPLYPFNDDLEVNAIYISDSKMKFTLVSIDFCTLSYRTSLAIREAVSHKTGIPVESIVFHCTHNHSGPMNGDFRDIELTPLIERIVEAIQSAQSDSRPAEMASAFVNVGNRFSINRRMYIDGDLGTLTFRYGYNYLEDGSVDARWLLNERLTRWFGEIPEIYTSADPLLNYGSVDELLQLLVFRDAADKKILGSLLRFAAHVQLSMCASDWKYSSCVPGYARRRLRESLGGEAIFVNGPCGDLIAKEFMEFEIDKGKFSYASTPLGPSGELSCVDDYRLWELIPHEGKAMADKAIDSLDQESFAPLSSFKTASIKEYMPLREDIYPAKEKYTEDMIKAMNEYKRALLSNAPVNTIKKLAEAYNLAHWMEHIIAWYDIAEDDMKNRVSPYELQALSLNDIVLVGMPGEVVKNTGDYLRANTCGDRLITMTECSGDLGYIATREMFPFGSYEVNFGVNHITGEQKLREAAFKLIQSVF